MSRNTSRSAGVGRMRLDGTLLARLDPRKGHGVGDSQPGDRAVLSDLELDHAILGREAPTTQGR